MKDEGFAASLVFLTRRPVLFGCFEYGADDFVVAGTATEIAGQVEAYLFLGRMRIAVEQRFGSYNETGRADAALQGGTFEKALLQWVQLFTLGNSFDRCDLGTFGFGGEHEATIHRHIFEHDCTRAAIAIAATFLGSDQSEFIAQDFEQCLSSFTKKLDRLPIDRGSDLQFARHVRLPCFANLPVRRPPPKSV